MHRICSRIPLILLTSALVACGGGTGDNDASLNADSTDPTPDAATADATNDAATADAATADAATADAATADAGLIDAAASVDATVADAATLDATPDAFVDAASGSVITDVVIEDNPNSVLSCFVNWTTPLPATSVVEFGPGISYAYRTADDALVTNHRVLVIGMTAETLYHLRAVSVTADAAQSASADQTYTTGTLPAPIQACTVSVHDPDRARPGWTLTNLLGDGVAGAVAFNMEGEPVWYFIVPDTASPNMDITLVDDASHVLIGLTAVIEAMEVDLAGEVIWSGPLKSPARSAHHHYEKLANGNYLTLLREVQDSVSGDIIDMIAPDHSPVWSWNAFDHLPIGSGDWTHGNAAAADLTNGWVYFSARNLNTVFKINMSNGAPIWALGAGGDFAADPLATYPWTDKQHAPEILADGNVLIYDNGNTRGFTRVVEYELDTLLMTSELVWEFPGDAVGLDPWYTNQWHSLSRGDVDRLDNGNTLITATTVGRIFEVAPDKTVVWEMTLSDPTLAGTYKSERITPPLIEEL